MPKFTQWLGAGLTTTAMLVASSASASSHREAPGISKDAFADNTDTYVFISPENDNNVVLAASWIPFEAPEGGPNYFEWDDTADYKISVDTDGDAAANFVYTLNSCTRVIDDQTFLYSTGAINSKMDSTWNRKQWIRVTETNTATGGTVTLVGNGNDGFDGTQTDCGKGQLTAPVNIGSKSTPDYATLFAEGIFETTDAGDNIKVFGGQTDDAFFVDLQVFDLLTLRGQPAPIGYSEGPDLPNDAVAGFNVHTMVVEVPITRLIGNDSEADPVIGMWSSTDRDGTQVSRLGMPLVNEVVFPYALKDTFNAIPPSSDFDVYGLLQESVEDPEVGNLLCDDRLSYGVPLPGDANDDCVTEYTPGEVRSGRGDIVDIFVQGMVLATPFPINTAGGQVTLPAGFNVNRPETVRPAEMIRINTAIKGDTCAPTPHPLGILGGDACGFPNGRRLADDVTDIALLAVGGAAYSVLDNRDTDYTFNADLLGILRDGVDSNDKSFSDSFPYFAMPHQGQSRQHENPKTASDDNGGGGGLGSLSVVLLGLLAMVSFGATASNAQRRKKANV